MRNTLKTTAMIVFVMSVTALIFVFAACENDTTGGNKGPSVVSIAEIKGVDIPLSGAFTSSIIIETEQYAGSVTWEPDPLKSGSVHYSSFVPNTQYTATITLRVKTGYTLEGVRENFFTVAGATAANAANSGVITAVFPETFDFFTDIASLRYYLLNSPYNTADTPYTIVLNSNSFTEVNVTDKKTLDEIIREARKYVVLDLSGSTFALPNKAFNPTSYVNNSTGNIYLVGITIGNGVTSIGDSAFLDCRKLTSATIGEGITGISNSLFSGCENLVSVNISDSVKRIGAFAFSGCASLTGITIPNSITSIEPNTFENSGLTSITIPNSITSIEVETFKNCKKLASITIPNSVTSIGSKAFRGCTSLADITIPDSITSIGIDAFRDCTSLANVNIPNSITNIDWGTFESSGLTSIIIPAGVTSIGNGAFLYCANLTSVTFEGEIDWHKIDGGAFLGNLISRYSIELGGGGRGTYTTKAPVSTNANWTKQP